jgi:uncharacterized protein (TIGR02302 family)
MTYQPQIPDGTPPLPPGLRRRRLLAQMVLLFERIWPALWPPLGVAGLFLCAALLNLPPMLPAWLHAALLVVVALAVLGLVANGLRRIAAPSAGEADRRLERDSGLRHRPLAVFTDRPVVPGAEALWRAHVARAAAQIGRLRVGTPRPGLAALDPLALRGALVVALFACLVIAGTDAPLRLARATMPVFAPQSGPPATEMQAWITAPAYAGMAPLFLKSGGKPVTVPAGSHLTVNLTGGTGTPSLTLNGKTTPFETLGSASFQADRDLSVGGRLAVRRGGQELGAWDLTVVADRAPEVSFPEPPGATRGGRSPQTRLPWQVSHDYGVVSLQAELRLRARPDDPPIVVAIPLPGGSPKSAKGVRLQDLTANPWAGLPVTARLVARDAAGLTGTSADAVFDLPERQFQNPVARALMKVRKMLVLKPDQRVPAVVLLDRLALLDDVWKDDAGGFLNLSSIIALLHRDQSPKAVPEAQSRIWQLALHLEEGGAEQTARALEQARQALRDALDAQQRGEKVDPAEIDKRMRDLQEALDRRLQALAEQARRDPTTHEFDPDSQSLDAQDMQRKAEQMRDAARQGKMDDARQKMAELEKMLEALQNARPEHGQMTQAQRERAEKRQRGQQQMSVLQDIIRREGGLLDHAQGRADASPDARRRLGQFGQQFGQQPPPSGNNPQQDGDRKADQTVQRALRSALGELMQQYGDLTGQIPPNLGDADAAMQQSAQALASGQDSNAADAQQRAIEALQKGGRGMSQQMARQFGRGQQSGNDGQEGEDGSQDGSQDGQGQMTGNDTGGDQYGNTPGGSQRDGSRSANRQGGDQRDPLGRRLRPGTSGAVDNGDVQVPDEMEAARSRAIQEELRRRGADRTRPQPELDYIGRLLEQF